MQRMVFYALCFTLSALGSVVDSAKPNIVFILIDDMGWPDVACYGHLFHETPHIDELASQGMRFTDFYAASPVCSSTRASIQTGQYSARVGITDFIPGHWRPFEKLIVPPIETALPTGLKTPGDVLRSAGYKTAYFGKWHLGDGPLHRPHARGYEFVASNLGAEFAKSREGRSPGPKRIDLLTDQTIWFMEQHKDQPFFVTLSHHAVHIRIEASPGSMKKYRSKTKPDQGVNHIGYAAMVEDLDLSIGRIMAKLRELQLEENTVVVFTSDNGGLRQIYTKVGEIVSTNAPLRDEKGTLYEGGIRVPMIVRWPNVVAENSICKEISTTADLLPTFAKIASADLPSQPMDGTSLVSLLNGSNLELARDSIFFHYPHYHHSSPGGAIRSGKWKLIEFFADDSLELYDLDADLSETRNLAKTHPDVAKSLQAKLSAWRKKVGARMPKTNPDHDSDRAHEWWSRRTKKKLDIQAMRKRYESRKP